MVKNEHNISTALEQQGIRIIALVKIHKSNQIHNINICLSCLFLTLGYV